jgi:hypothetical protein
MNANELADKLLENNTVSWGDCTYEQHDNDKHFKKEAATMLRQQQDRIGVLEANHKIQLNINEKALQYIEQLEQGLKASINLNRAQNERKRTS